VFIRVHLWAIHAQKNARAVASPRVRAIFVTFSDVAQLCFTMHGKRRCSYLRRLIYLFHSGGAGEKVQ
jgi:hypothetical protein